MEEKKDGVISLDLFKKVGELKICQSKETKFTDEGLVKSVNIPSLIEMLLIKSRVRPR